jgi:acyl carrier protein
VTNVPDELRDKKRNDLGDVPVTTISPPDLRQAIKALILDAADKPEPAGGIADDEILFGPDARLELDSLDALQVSMAIQERFGLRMADSKETRRALASVASLADYLIACQAPGLKRPG